MTGDGQRTVAAISRSHLELCGATRGAVGVVAANGSQLYAFGLDAEPTTVFRIASMTKSFTAAVVLSLRDEGVFHLDEPVSVFAPEFGSVVGPGTDPAPITLRHLLTMSSGLATDDPWADRHLDATDDDLDHWVTGGLRFAHPTGTAFEYSNLGYALIGRVVHRVTGQRVQDLVRERFLQPLGMTHTAWTIADLPQDADVAQGMHPGDDGQTTEQPLGDGVVAPMGGLWSCVGDMGQWINFLSSAFTDTPVPGRLAARSRREMQQLHRGSSPRTDRAADGAVRTESGGYAMGLTTSCDEQSGWAVSHSGGLPGFGSNMRWIPGGVGVVALANVTYAPMRHTTAAIMTALTHGEFVTCPTGEPDPGVVVSAERFAVILSRWDETEAPDVFADNVFRDESVTARRRQIAVRCDDGAPVQLISVERDGGAAGLVTLLIGDQLHRLRLELAPLAEPLIQAYDWL